MNDPRAEAYAKTLSRLLQAETISSRDQPDKSKFSVFHALLRETFPHLFSVCAFEEFDGSILLRWPGSDSARLPILLMNHHDVVEAGDGWRYPPFSGTIAEGRVWGRGALDTKGGLCMMLQAADELAAEGFVPAQDVYFESACTEETTGAGADAISQELQRRGLRFSLVLDEGGMILHDPIGGSSGDFAMVGVGEKGCADLRFIARSSGGHASTPGKNTPLARLGKFMAACERLPLFPAEVSPTVEEMLRRMAPTMDGALGKVCGNAHALRPLLAAAMPSVSAMAGAMLRTTLAFTMAHGSDGYNVLPQEAWVTGNMRFSPHQGQEKSIRAVTHLAHRFDIEVEVIDPGFPSPVSDFRSEAFARIERAVDAVFPGVITAPYLMTGASDARYFTRVCDNCLRFSPFFITDEQLAGIHGRDENVFVSTLPDAVDFYKYILTEV